MNREERILDSLEQMANVYNNMHCSLLNIEKRLEKMEKALEKKKPVEVERKDLTEKVEKD